jgi:hypothetical protein
MKGANGFIVNHIALACRNIILLFAVVFSLAVMPARAQDSLVIESNIQMISVAQPFTPDTHGQSCMCADCNHLKCCCKAMTDTTPVFRPVCALPSTELLNGSSFAPRCTNGINQLTLAGGFTSILEAKIPTADAAANTWSSKPPLAPPRG